MYAATKISIAAALVFAIGTHAGCLTSAQQDIASAQAELAFARGDSAVAWAAWDAANMDSSACQLPGVAFQQAAEHERNVADVERYAAAEPVVPAPVVRASALKLQAASYIGTRGMVAVRAPEGCGATWCATEED